MRRLVFIPLCVMAATAVEAEPHAHMQSDPLLAKLMIDRLEVRDVEGPNPVKWDIQGWLGGDLRKLWLKSEGRYVDGETAAAELQVLYDRAVSPYWNVQAGWRGDLEPDPQRDQPLLCAVVQVTLDLTPGCVRGRGDPGPRGVHLGERPLQFRGQAIVVEEGADSGTHPVDQRGLLAH